MKNLNNILFALGLGALTLFASCQRNNDSDPQPNSNARLGQIDPSTQSTGKGIGSPLNPANTNPAVGGNGSPLNPSYPTSSLDKGNSDNGDDDNDNDDNDNNNDAPNIAGGYKISSLSNYDFSNPSNTVNATSGTLTVSQSGKNFTFNATSGSKKFGPYNASGNYSNGSWSFSGDVSGYYSNGTLTISKTGSNSVFSVTAAK